MPGDADDESASPVPDVGDIKKMRLVESALDVAVDGVNVGRDVGQGRDTVKDSVATSSVHPNSRAPSGRFLEISAGSSKGMDDPIDVATPDYTERSGPLTARQDGEDEESWQHLSQETHSRTDRSASNTGSQPDVEVDLPTPPGPSLPEASPQPSRPEVSPLPDSQDTSSSHWDGFVEARDAFVAAAARVGWQISSEQLLVPDSRSQSSEGGEPEM